MATARQDAQIVGEFRGLVVVRVAAGPGRALRRARFAVGAALQAHHR